ncbi:hypothetical protein ACVW0J_004331 [Bradyrhizobium sp. i1.7.7]
MEKGKAKAELPGAPAPGQGRNGAATAAPQERQLARHVIRNQEQRKQDLRRDIGNRDREQAAKPGDRDELPDLSEPQRDVLRPHRAAVFAAHAIEAGNQIGRQREQRADGDREHRGVEGRHPPKTENCGGRKQLGADDQQRAEHHHDPHVNPHHARVEARRASVAIDAGLEGEKPVDGAKLQAAIRDDDEASGRKERKPGSEHVAAPKVQECGDEEKLLRQRQQHLHQICRPAVNKPVKAAAALFAFGAVRPAWRVNLRIGQTASFPQTRAANRPNCPRWCGARGSVGLHPIAS